ncbi:PAS domain-containing protein, partial [Leptodesmis sp.]|uniref:PAS domain-containing protein n=1 Tax=Leptodesmis sp. TaxID=3100501 RepID=UPI0040535683
PLVVGDRIWGSLTLHTCQQPFTWPDEQVALAQTVAGQLEVAIQQAELYQQVEQEKQKLFDSQMALVQAQQIAQVGSWELDATTQAMVWSDTLFQIFGFDPAAPEPDLAEVMMNYVHPEDRPRLEQCLTQAMTEGNFHEIDLRFFRTDGTMGYMEARAEAVRNDQGQIVKVVGTSLDISDRKQAELQIHQLNEALEQQNRNLENLVEQRTAELVQQTIQLEASNKELEFFSYSVSHDLRAPLRHIHGFVSALQQRLQGHNALSDPKVAHYMQVIQNSSQKMAQLIDGLLDLSRIGRKPMELRPVILRHLVEEAIAPVQHNPDIGTAAEFVIGELPIVQGDARLLQQVFSNLVSNAVKFSRNLPLPGLKLAVCQRG